MIERAAFYIDGFNLYHAIADLNKNYLKWLNLRHLCQSLIAPKTEQIVRVAWCTAIKTDDSDKMIRHRALIKAQINNGVDCLQGHFSKEDRSCRECGAIWAAPTEKQGDVNLALAVLDDAYRDIYDVAYLVTSDGDQAATAKLLKDRFPGKRLITVAPPQRSHNRIILAVADGHRKITIDQLERAVLPRGVQAGDSLVVRPAPYNPPDWWVHPNNHPER